MCDRRLVPAADAFAMAEYVVGEMAHYCQEIAVAGELRRGEAFVKEIEIVCIPTPWPMGGPNVNLSMVVQQWPWIKGGFHHGWTIRMVEKDGLTMRLNITVAKPANWGFLLAVRTGPLVFVESKIYKWLNRRGYKIEGNLIYKKSGELVPVESEKALFELLDMKFIYPAGRV